MRNSLVKIAIAVPPYNTSQNCSNCGEKGQKGLSTRTHVCPDCEYVEDRETALCVSAVVAVNETLTTHTLHRRLCNVKRDRAPPKNE